MEYPNPRVWCSLCETYHYGRQEWATWMMGESNGQKTGSMDRFQDFTIIWPESAELSTERLRAGQ